jgi:ribosomal protein S18 acetylase RimI-like enzyme
MVAQAIRISSTSDQDRAIATLTSAFSDDPVCRWIWRDEGTYTAYFGPFIRAFAGRAFELGSAHAAEHGEAVALWLPPGVRSDDDALVRIAEESIADDIKDDAFGFLGQQAEVHPHEPHWYLPLIGVEVAARGRGLGSALLEHALRIVDSDGLPAYLEATSERNRALYERHGFEVTGEIQYGGSPPMWPMYRRAR